MSAMRRKPRSDAAMSADLLGETGRQRLNMRRRRSTLQASIGRGARDGASRLDFRELTGVRGSASMITADPRPGREPNAPRKGSHMRTALMALALAVTFSASDAQAQAAPAAPAQVPDAMPFDIPFGTPITASRAAQVVQAVVAEAQKAPRNWKLAIAVVDPNGDLVYFFKMDGTQIASTQVAIGKARTSARFRRATQVFFDQMQMPAGAFTATLDPTLIA